MLGQRYISISPEKHQKIWAPDVFKVYKKGILDWNDLNRALSAGKNSGIVKVEDRNSKRNLYKFRFFYLPVCFVTFQISRF